MKRKFGLIIKMIVVMLVVETISWGIIEVSIMTTDDTRDRGLRIYDQNLLGMRYLDEMVLNLHKAISSLQYVSIFSSIPERLSLYTQNFKQNCQDFEASAENFRKTIPEGSETTAVDQLITYNKEYMRIGLEVASLIADQRSLEANQISERQLASIRSEKLEPLLEELVQVDIKNAEETYQFTIDRAAASKRFIRYIEIAGIIISLVLAFQIIRSVTRPIRHLSNTLADSSGQIEVSSSQLSASSIKIAEGSQEQAASIQETSASMEELASMVKQNLENIRHANSISEQARLATMAGFTKMQELQDSMHSIAKSTEDIKAVIDVIDDIAFQTNMLALNAAVEAARAGEVGMGFAVVADEVKNLANRSSKSAKETALMIKESVKFIEKGNIVSKEMAELFSEIMTNTKKVDDMNQQVEIASTQQEEGINQVNNALIQFDSIVQENATSSQETASAAEELHSQVDTMNKIVSDLNFVIKGGKAS